MNCGIKIPHIRGKFKADCPIRRESLQGHAKPNRKRGDLACEAGTEIFLGILHGAVHQDEAFEVERGEISCRAFEPFFACMPQIEPTMVWIAMSGPGEIAQ